VGKVREAFSLKWDAFLIGGTLTIAAGAAIYFSVQRDKDGHVPTLAVVAATVLVMSGAAFLVIGMIGVISAILQKSPAPIYLDPATAPTGTESFNARLRNEIGEVVRARSEREQEEGRELRITRATHYFRGQDVALMDLMEEGSISNRTFEDCRLTGPAILVLAGVGLLHQCRFEGDAIAVFWEIAPERTAVTGAILTNNCTFRRCTFSRVGLAGTTEQIKRFAAGFLNSGEV
jgi:hypothetical protein